MYASEANLQIPQMVIKFYESKLTWHESTDDSKSVLVDIIPYQFVIFSGSWSLVTVPACFSVLVYVVLELEVVYKSNEANDHTDFHSGP